MATITTSQVGSDSVRFAGLKKRISIVFEFLSVICIPTLFLSCLLISIQILPGVADLVVFKFPLGQAMGNTAAFLMTTSVEVAMVGCYAISQSAARSGQQSKASKYGAFGWGFFFLFAITVLLFVVAKFTTLPPWVDVVLMIVRCLAAGLYAFLCHSDEDERPALTVQQVNHLDAMNASIEKLANSINELQIQQTKTIDTVHSLALQVKELSMRQSESVHTGIDTTIDTSQFVGMDQFNQLNGIVKSLAGTINQMHVSVTEVSTNILQISSKVSSVQTDVQVDQTREANTQQVTDSRDTGHIKALDMPVLTVPKISQEKVTQVLSLYLSGISWTKIQDLTGLNYSRVIKPVKEAYELSIQSIDTMDTIDSSIDTRTGL